MDFIASELGISKRTLYENFKNKDALIIACLEQTREQYHKQFIHISENDTNTIVKLVRYYEVIADFIIIQVGHSSLMLNECILR